MTAPIVHELEPITLIGGGEVGEGDLALALERAPVLVAADGGADTALALGHRPVAVIGDFDSLTDAARAALPEARMIAIAEQDSTDFDKALRHIAAPLVLGVGFLGGRIDHQLAAFNTLVRQSDHRCILIGERELVFQVPPKIEVGLAAGDVVSLFPMRLVSGRSQGLAWPIDGLELSPGGRVATSNRALGRVVLELDGSGGPNDPGGLLMITPRGSLDAVMRALRPG
ncbi:MAG: thiamine diphosphokinase [Rhodobacteraceae bacterium]|nr:thiamine diphosphokinase [Paracoccaceae bacterium]